MCADGEAPEAGAGEVAGGAGALGEAGGGCDGVGMGLGSGCCAWITGESSRIEASMLQAKDTLRDTLIKETV
jgi:hypothetical protein